MRRRRLRLFLAAILALGGVALLADFVLTLAWQEPLSFLRARSAQKRLGEDLARAQHRARTHRAHFAARLLNRSPARRPLGRIRIPRLGADFVFVQGTGPETLKLGPGHYMRTVLPGRRGTVGIAGHRTTYLAPFRHLDDLHPGDRIVLEMPYAGYTYRVTRTRIVDASDGSVLRNTRHSRLVLTACNPVFSAAQRIVVTARLASVWRPERRRA
jgi:sortase A